MPADVEGLQRWGELLARWRSTDRVREGAKSALSLRTVTWAAGKGPKPADEYLQQIERLDRIASDLVDEIDRFVRNKLN
ncbi:MAG: hypothetical protein EON54_26030 [Alcaligenaceae bacterium]|nr:MAG: hypothetical protein EON54_26030 [Alcaligenaceae bacterium]